MLKIFLFKKIVYLPRARNRSFISFAILRGGSSLIKSVIYLKKKKGNEKVTLKMCSLYKNWYKKSELKYF